MSKNHTLKERLSYRLPSLLPEYLKSEAPAFESFLKAYFEFLEAEVLTLTEQGDLDGIANEDGTGSIFLETATVSPSPDKDTSKIIFEQTATNRNASADPFTIGEYVVGSKSKSVAKVEVINGNVLYLKSVSGNGFSKGELVTGRDSNQTGTVGSYKENSILANNRLLDYSDIDETTEEFLQYFQKDFMPSIDLATLQNSRLTIKNITDLYKKKGTGESLQFLMRLLYAQDAEIRYPINETIHVSESGYSQQRRMRISMTSGIPEANDKITQYALDGKTIVAQAIIENVYTDNSETGLYSLEIINNHVGEFTKGSSVTILDRDGITALTATVNGIISDITVGSSTYVAHNDNGDILLEDGYGLLYETKSKPFGSLYTLNDKINIVGGKADTDTTECLSVVNGLHEGGITEILIENSGDDYSAGDLIIFEGGQGFGGESIIGSINDTILLEQGTKDQNKPAVTEWEFTATSGQTVFGGPSVVDDKGDLVFFNDSAIQVFVDGLEMTRTTEFTSKNDRVTLVSALNAGQVLNIYTEFNNIVYEDGSIINHETATGEIKSIKITSGGQYTSIPKVFPGGYIYFDDLSGFLVGESVTGGTSNATGIISSIDTKNKRLVVKRLPTDTGAFQNLELITGGSSETERNNTQVNITSGSGALMYAFSDTIGGISSINIQDQGNMFDANGVVSTSSHHPMVISTPSATLTRDLTFTGVLSGSTAKVVSYDIDRHILTYTSLEGDFFENEVVTFNSTDSFKVLKSNKFDGQGLFNGEGIIEEQMVGDYGTIDASASRVQDGKFYQTHSYVVKVGESINKWRGIVKDLLHPAGHIFFGEVAIKNTIDTTVEDQVRFRPTVIIPTNAVLGVPTPFTNSMREIEIYTLSSEIDPVTIAELKDAGVPNVGTDPRTGGSITEPYTEYGDSSHRNRHFNINIIQSHALGTTQVGMHSHDGIPTVLSLDSADNGYLVRSTERRPSNKGKIFQVWEAGEETLLMEDGSLIELEDIPNYLKFEPRLTENVYFQGTEGERIITEDGVDIINLEDASVPVHHVGYFVSERNTQIDGGIYFEDGDRIISEDSTAFMQEGLSESGISSFVPFGSTYRTLNTITGQRVYDISYYLKDETDADDLLLEDGTGNVLSEESNPEGLRISDLDTYFPNHYMSEFDSHARKRTNITFSAYIKSA